MSISGRQVRRALGGALLAIVGLSCAPSSPRITVYFRVDDEQFRPEYLLVTWLTPDGKDQPGIRVPKDGPLDTSGPLLGSLEVDMTNAPAGDRTVIAWGMKRLLQVSGARSTVQWEPGSRREVTLTLGCVQTTAGPPVMGQVSQAPWLACKTAAPDGAPLDPADAAVLDAADRTADADGPDAGAPDTGLDLAALDVAAAPDLAGDVHSDLPVPDARPAVDVLEAALDGAPDRHPPDPLPPGADLGKGLLAYYRLDDPPGSSSARDSSGNAMVATLQALDPSTAWVPGYLGGALDVAGKGWASVGATPALNTLVDAFTFSAWIDRTADGTIVSRRYVGANGFVYRLFVAGGRLGLQINSSSGANANLAGSAVPAGGWVHVAARYDSREAVLFLSGAAVARAPYSVSLPSEASPLELGADQDATLVSADQRFAGKLDELAIYNRALSDAEVAALAGGNLPPAK
jgi:hypothetical protein